MDRFDAMRVFARIVERRSFTQAADDLGLPRSSVTDAVKGLEARLGVRLLQRTTRQVNPTLDGEAYYQRCVSLIAEMEDAEGAFVGAKPSGLVRVDVHGTQARYFLLPGLPRFRQQYPDIRLHFSEAHQPLDMIREGFDCILRAGDSGIAEIEGTGQHMWPDTLDIMGWNVDAEGSGVTSPCQRSHMWAETPHFRTLPAWSPTFRRSWRRSASPLPLNTMQSCQSLPASRVLAACVRYSTLRRAASAWNGSRLSAFGGTSTFTAPSEIPSRHVVAATKTAGRAEMTVSPATGHSQLVFSSALLPDTGAWCQAIPN